MGFRAWGYKTNKVYALSVGAAQADATSPVGFVNGGGQYVVYNSGATDVLVAFYKNANGKPTLTFPVSGAPPVGEAGTIIPKGDRVQVSGPIDADSFSAIGSAAGPSIIYVQRGDGST